MSAPTAGDERADVVLAAMLAAWVRDIDGEPVPDIVEAVLRGDHAPTHALAAS